MSPLPAEASPLTTKSKQDAGAAMLCHPLLGVHPACVLHSFLVFKRTKIVGAKLPLPPGIVAYNFLVVEVTIWVRSGSVWVGGHTSYSTAEQ